jgi:hypothetical protein
MTREFFATVQNKLHWAITGKTAAELIYESADAQLPYMGLTVGMIVGMLASGHSKQTVLDQYPYLESEDIGQALAYAAWRSEEMDLPFPQAS